MINLKMILCPIDLSESSMKALGYAQAVAARYSAMLTVIYILENPYLDIPGGETGAFTFGEIVDLYKEEREETILDFLRKGDAPAVKVDVIFREGVRHEKIVEVAREIKSDMIIMASQTRGSSTLSAGHTTERVVRLSPCPVLSIQVDKDPKKNKKSGYLKDLMDINSTEKRTILLPTDFSECSMLAAEYAISLAKEYKAEILVLHVMERAAEISSILGNDMPGYGAVLVYYEDLLKSAQNQVKEICDIAAEKGVKADQRVISGNPRHEILTVADSENVDMIVIGTHGRRGLSRLIQGSVAEAIVRHARCSILSIRKPEYKV